MNKNVSILVWLAALFMAGCATTVENKPDESNAPVTVKKFVDSHAAIMNELAQIKGDTRLISAPTQENLKTAQSSLGILEEMSRRHGSGEISLFFPAGSVNLERAERERLINFADFLARESRGRKILFVSIGSASALGDYKFNLKLAKKRSEAPTEVLDKYLINVPHEFYKVYGTGDMYSPKKALMKEHQHYQHVRVIAVFDSSQLPKNLVSPIK